MKKYKICSIFSSMRLKKPACCKNKHAISKQEDRDYVTLSTVDHLNFAFTMHIHRLCKNIISGLFIFSHFQNVSILFDIPISRPRLVVCIIIKSIEERFTLRWRYWSLKVVLSCLRNVSKQITNMFLLSVYLL